MTRTGVPLLGLATSRAGHDIIDTVRHTEGVVFVWDRLSYPDDSACRPRLAK